MAKIIDCTVIAEKIKEEVKREVSKIYKDTNERIVLVVIQVGNDSASNIYIKNKARACREVGIDMYPVNLPENVSEDYLCEWIQSLNRINNIHGILVQLPLPNHINEEKIINTIIPEKDIDGFSNVSTGKLVNGYDFFSPCTPAGIMEIIKYLDYDLKGKNCLVIGRSNIVGKPVAHLLLQQNATVTIAHSYTKNLKELCNKANLIVVAVGKPNFLDSSYFYTENAELIIDVGINRVNGKLCGDVDKTDFDKLLPYTKVTPVPKGVGATTVAMVVKNCLELYKKYHLKKE